jgi:hypothetical protein
VLPTLQNPALYSNNAKEKNKVRKEDEETSPKVVIKHLNRRQLYKGQVAKGEMPALLRSNI